MRFPAHIKGADALPGLGTSRTEAKPWQGRALTRRQALALASLPLLDAVLPASAVTRTPRTYDVLAALEAHGQWAQEPRWAFDIHSELGVSSVVVGKGVASGTQGVPEATERALAGLRDYLPVAAGAVVIVAGRSDLVSCRTAKQALNLVRDVLPLGAFGVFSPLVRDQCGEKTTVHLSLGW